MAAAGVEDIEVGSCLPSHLLHHQAIWDWDWDWETKKIKNGVKYGYHHRYHSMLPPTEPFPVPALNSNASLRRNQKPRYWSSSASGGPGMQAFFLDSGKKSPGTGVFLPRRAGTGTHLHSNTRPAACSPVLLPSRVVRALNLNVQELGLQISPRRGLPLYLQILFFSVPKLLLRIFFFPGNGLIEHISRGPIFVAPHKIIGNVVI
ncbi:hypothetical protein V6N11_037026 [Hibiscus sabdariffa]|uniref:Uncharacterized protein n=1 Tax=Hibiscus sabdariffa TaxID=183260 RepID=A0ABR1ZYF6_9ROSI